MQPASIDEVSASNGATNESRRNVLKEFGRYAAAAPTVMLLLHPSESHAKNTKSKRQKKAKSHY
jgi:hypothetical protein